MLSTTASRSASSKTTTGALPPSSRCTRLSVSAAAAATALPVATSPVNETISTPGCLTMLAPTGSPSPVMMLSTPPGKMSAASSAIIMVVSGVCSDGLRTTDRVARRKRRGYLPDGHHQGVVSRGYLPYYAHGLATDHACVPARVLAGGLTFEEASRPGEEAQVVDDVRHLRARGSDRLSDVSGFGQGELFGVFLQEVGEPVEHLEPLGRRRIEPALECRARGLDGPSTDEDLLPIHSYAHGTLLLATRPLCTRPGPSSASHGR